MSSCDVRVVAWQSCAPPCVCCVPSLTELGDGCHLRLLDVCVELLGIRHREHHLIQLAKLHTTEKRRRNRQLDKRRPGQQWCGWMMTPCASRSMTDSQTHTPRLVSDLVEVVLGDIADADGQLLGHGADWAGGGGGWAEGGGLMWVTDERWQRGRLSALLPDGARQAVTRHPRRSVARR